MDFTNDLGAYVDAQEQMSGVNGDVTTVKAEPINIPANNKKVETPDERANRINTELNKIGWHKLPINTLPTSGLFYEPDMEVYIRAAKGEEIKHWSTMDDEEALSISNMMDYIIEKCTNVRSKKMGASWRDLKDVDRLYILLAIRELTFIDEDNNLMVSVSEGKDIPVSKEMVHYVEIPENVMKHYSPEERCFIFNLKKGSTIKMYIPSFGVNEWLMNYIREKSETKVNFDADFIQYAPMLIADYRGLTKKSYEDLVMDSHAYGTEEWAIISHVYGVFKKVFVPSLKFTKEDGTEEIVPLTFQGGIKSIFSLSDPLSVLC